MRNLKKFVALSLVAGMTLLAGCGSKVPENTVNSVNDLPGKTIGVQLGTTGDIYASDYEEPADADTPASKIERYNKGNDAVQALKQGKIDCVIIDEQPAKAFVEKNDDLKILDEEFAVEEYAICISKDNKDLTEKINSGRTENFAVPIWHRKIKGSRNGRWTWRQTHLTICIYRTGKIYP